VNRCLDKRGGLIKERAKKVFINGQKGEGVKDHKDRSREKTQPHGGETEIRGGCKKRAIANFEKRKYIENGTLGKRTESRCTRQAKRSG